MEVNLSGFHCWSPAFVLPFPGYLRTLSGMRNIISVCGPNSWVLYDLALRCTETIQTFKAL